jgi:hypothetical protein
MGKDVAMNASPYAISHTSGRPKPLRKRVAPEWSVGLRYRGGEGERQRARHLGASLEGHICAAVRHGFGLLSSVIGFGEARHPNFDLIFRMYQKIWHLSSLMCIDLQFFPGCLSI